MYKPYVTYQQYIDLGRSALAKDDAPERLRRASRDVDGATFNRIRRKGFDVLTDFQKEVIAEAVCLQAEFIAENADIIESAIKSYSIGGVSVALEECPALVIIRGVAWSREAFDTLKQSGLTTLNLRYR